MDNLSKSQIKKLGREIRRGLRISNIISEPNLNKLQLYRISHQPALRDTFDFLVKKSRQYHKGSLVVYRLKRIDTIKRKIERYSTMDLSLMQDVAGCRAIVDSETQILKIVNEFNKDSNFEIIDFDDYLTNPRETGYKSYHLIVKPKNYDKVVEVQLRTRIHHHWATLVEITDLVFDVKLKEGQDHPDLFKFHKYLSKEKENLSFEEREDIISIERKHELIDKLITVFKSNYFLSVERWIKAIPENSKPEYLIMELDDNLSPNFSFFEDFVSAENKYFKKFNNMEPEMVLIHTNNLDFEKLDLAYSNYVLTSHPSIREYIKILMLNIKEHKKRGNKNEFKLQLDYLNNIFKLIINSFVNEINVIDDNSLGEGVNLSYDDLINNWRESLSQRIKFILELEDQFQIELKQIRKPNIFKKVFRI